jgi:hypothetical protein
MIWKQQAKGRWISDCGRWQIWPAFSGFTVACTSPTKVHGGLATLELAQEEAENMAKEGTE